MHSFVDGIVSVTLSGACNGCPSSTVTLKQGIESLLKQKMGEKIKEVVKTYFTEDQSTTGWFIAREPKN